MLKSQKPSKLHRKRLRVFAGPNGSGKTTLATNLSKEGHFKLSIFVNADIVEEKIRTQGHFDFNEFNISISTGELKEYIKNYGAAVIRGKMDSVQLLSDISIIDNKFFYAKEINSYISADVCAFCRIILLEKGESFIMETVFSHKSKLDLMKKAKALGYHVYFYFVSTDAPEVNVNRVKIRVKNGGHDVPEEKIISRYYKSLEILNEAIKLSYRSYLWDNSNTNAELFAEIHSGEGKIRKNIPIPNWFIQYVLEKNP